MGNESRTLDGTILFSVVGRTHYGFDIFCLDVPPSLHSRQSFASSETLLTDEISVNLNGSFASSSDGKQEKLVYVSERTGSPQLYINSETKMLELGPLQFTSPGKGHADEPSGLFFDRPSMYGDKVYFVATQKEFVETRECYTAVYVSSLSSGRTTRLTPPGVADFSPSLSPSGKWVAVASYEGRGWQGDIEDLHTNIYVFKAEDGSERKLVVEDGGWPTWADDDTLYFHKKSDDGWWSIYKVSNWAHADSLADVERITPPCVHAFTPVACPTTVGHWLAVATRRPDSKWRHVEIFDLASEEFIEVTAKVHPEQHHYNPFLSARTGRLGYHRCRDIYKQDSNAASCEEVDALSPTRVPRLEAMDCPVDGLQLVRVDGFFPSVSPCGRFIAYNKNLPGSSDFGIYIMRADGSKSWLIARENLFYTIWDKHREGIIYGTLGGIFAPASASVQVAALHVSMDALTDDVEKVSGDMKILTRPDTGNNGFPAPSPDGKWLVFRSGRAGGKGKNLYIMDAQLGEDGEVRWLTCGDWTDTMPSWSPDGQWIAFSSTMHGVNEGSFGLYMIRPDGTGLHRVQPRCYQNGRLDENGVEGAVHGRINHVCFSPDGGSIVFTADLTGVSAEPISLPNQFQPYGEIFVSRLDGSGLVRLTHNAYEDGTPSWAPISIKLPHQQPSVGPAVTASVGSESLRGEFMEPLFLNRITEEMKSACCV
ncbi:hypothetical protein L7F22_057049 [Adiantum nelumboides]|nr:hypothetical protein [Adiantum nelumboides]